ncbi:MAG: TetR family transcriptional regulator [Pirellulaceae bacterium]
MTHGSTGKSTETGETLGTKERLVQAAGPIFARSGFAEATVREICDSAGANLAAINYHFGDKWGLYVATIEAAHLRLMDIVPYPAWPESVSAAEEIVAVHPSDRAPDDQRRADRLA